MAAIASSSFCGSCIRLIDCASTTAPRNTKAITAKARAEFRKVRARALHVSCPFVKPSRTAAATPTAADSVGVAMPANRLPSTATISARMGHTGSSARSVGPQGSGVSRCTSSGRRRATHSIHSMNSSAIIRPGSTPARKSLPIEVSVSAP